MMKQTTRLRHLLSQGKLVVAPGCWDPFSAKVVQWLGFSAAYIGGHDTGAHLGIPEPLLSLTEQANTSEAVAKAVQLPIVTDGGAGWGDTVHTARCVQAFEEAGVAGIHLEDQVFPKITRQHRSKEHGKTVFEVIEAREFARKIRAAVDFRKDKDFLVIARTDVGNVGRTTLAMGEELLQKTIRRCYTYTEAGADMVMPFLADQREIEQFRRELPDVLLMCLAETRTTAGLVQTLSPGEMEDLGVNMVIFSVPMVVSARAIIDSWTTLKDTGRWDIPHLNETERTIQEIIGAPEWWKIEGEYENEPGRLPQSQIDMPSNQ